MTKFNSKLLTLACTTLALLCACGEFETQPIDSNSQRCSDNSKITGFLADFGGYKKGQSIPFKHSDGYLFSLMVTDRQNYIDELCQKHLNTSLESPYPIYSLLLSGKTNTFYYDEKDKQNSGLIEVDFGQYRFSLRNPNALKNTLIATKVNGKDTMFYGIDSSYIDTIKINDVHAVMDKNAAVPMGMDPVQKFMDIRFREFFQLIIIEEFFEPDHVFGPKDQIPPERIGIILCQIDRRGMNFFIILQAGPAQQ